MKKIWIIVIAIVIVLLLFGVYQFIAIRNTFAPSETNECVTDADCVKADCCHSTACVSADKAPNCSGVFCTQVCSPGTLDCGQGSCNCVNNRCQARFK